MLSAMLSACGVMCSECPAYHGADRGAAHQRRVAKAWQRIYGLEEAPEHISCGGCLGSDRDLFHTSRRCRARRCCLRNGFGSCGECPMERCGDLEHAQAVWDGVPALADRLSRADVLEYAAPYLGHRERLAAIREREPSPRRGVEPGQVR